MLGQRLAAVDVQRLAGEEGAGQREQDGVGDVVGGADAPGRVAGADVGEVSNDSLIASRSRSARRPRARAEAVETTWSTVPSRWPRAAMESSSVRSTLSVLIPGSPG